MANRYKNAQFDLNSTDKTDIYTCPSNSRAIVQNIHTANVGGGNVEIKAFIYDNSATTTIASNIQSGDYDIDQRRGLDGDGEFLMKIRRFIPDFLAQTGNTQITLNLRDYPNNSQASSPLGPFTISSTTTKIDTRARARSVALKVANTGSSQSWKLGGFRLDIQPDGRR